MAEHRVELVQFRHALLQDLDRRARRLGHLGEFLLAVRQEFVKRRIEQAYGDGQARHDPEDLGEIVALGREELGERGTAAGLLLGQDHLADIGRSEEHTSELQSLMRISYAVFCLKKKTKTHLQSPTHFTD